MLGGGGIVLIENCQLYYFQNSNNINNSKIGLNSNNIFIFSDNFQTPEQNLTTNGINESDDILECESNDIKSDNTDKVKEELNLSVDDENMKKSNRESMIICIYLLGHNLYFKLDFL